MLSCAARKIRALASVRKMGVFLKSAFAIGQMSGRSWFASMFAAHSIREIMVTATDGKNFKTKH